jgi:integrase
LFVQLRKEVEPSSFSLTTGLRKAEICNLKIGDLKTYRNQAVVDVIGKGKKSDESH